MDLLINYGTNASAGGQPVIAEIQIGGDSGTYTLPSTVNNSLWLVGTGDNGTFTATNWFRTETRINILAPALNVSTTNNYLRVGFHDSNGTAILFYSNSDGSSEQQIPGYNFIDYSNTTITVPTNAASFSITTSGNTINATVTYSDPTTTTFYDSYPGGNVISTTNGTDQGTYLQIDPPTGKRIKQIALKGL
jgi:hypothetical protein